MDIHLPKFRHPARQSDAPGHRIHPWMLFLVLVALFLIAVGSAGN